MLRNNLCAKYFFPFIFNAILWRNFSWLEALWSKVTVLLVVEGNRFSLSNGLFFTFFGSQMKTYHTATVAILFFWKWRNLPSCIFKFFVREQLCGASGKRSPERFFQRFLNLKEFSAKLFENQREHFFYTLYYSIWSHIDSIQKIKFDVHFPLFYVVYGHISWCSQWSICSGRRFFFSPLMHEILKVRRRGLIIVKLISWSSIQLGYWRYC